jgi:hypothetical protein
MKPSIVGAAIVLLLALGAALSGQQKSERGCDFNLSGDRVVPNITGPEEVVAIAHVVDQRDSPITIVSADFKDSYVSISNERFTQRLDCTLKVRNQSDRAVRSFQTSTGFIRDDSGIGGLSGFGGVPEMPAGRSLMPGEELEFQGCGGTGHGGAPNNRVRLLVAIESVLLDGCAYMPSRRFPTHF